MGSRASDFGPLFLVLANQIYYRLKPFLPWSLRMGVRRYFACRSRERETANWPIKPGSECPPAHWPGWPKGERFALVLTHDVERDGGLRKCPRLIALEKELGFRSSFNLIPEGSYSVSPEFREEIRSSGFEVGVHDLKHDGKLYRSRRDFQRSAPHINRYLAAWNAEGFRGGFMHHNLEWLHELNIRYDASTFDTDPFEPQPYGVNTIFPFWVPAPVSETAGSRFKVQGSQFEVQPPSPSTLNPPPSTDPGYVELPYTLPQDSTLFLVFRETTIDVWRTKLDWIARNGGMALLNVHPDYLRFDGAASSPRDFPAAYYRSFLEYVRERYEGLFWHALPGEVADFVRNTRRGAQVRSA